MILGAHFSIRRGLEDALNQAEALGCEAIQIFGYRRHEFLFDPRLGEAARRRLDAEMDAWRNRLGPGRRVQKAAVHSRAVALLASSDPVLRQKTIQTFREELSLAAKLNADFYIFHLGPYSGGTSSAEGLDLARGALLQILESAGPSPAILLENVPGGGRRLGSTLEELAYFAEALKPHGRRFGLCLDTAHLWTAGYEINTRARLERFAGDFARRLDPDLVQAVHFNNSSLPLGCHLDEHRHLWEGHIPKETYAFIAREWRQAVGILETPKDSPDADSKNLDFLRSLL